MNKVSDLVKRLCPEGVETARVRDLFSVVTLPAKLKRSEYTNGTKYPIVDQGQVLVCGFTDDETALLPEAEYIVFGDHTRIIKWVDFRFAAGADGTKVLRSNAEIIPRFGYYALSALSIPSRGYNRHWTVLRDMLLPVPPMEVQREIVRVLDAFTGLEQNLASELELRKKQFNHVRGLLVEVSQQTAGAKINLRDAESLGLVTMGRGMVISKKTMAALPGNYPVYSSSGLGNGEFGRYGDYMFDDERITWSIDGGGRLFYRPPHRYSVTNVSGWMTVNQPRLLVKYLYHVLLCQWEQERFDYTRKAHPSVIRDVYSFSIPSLDIQEQVVAQLDTFETLLASIEQEIDLRQKQYSYYRDQLLNFAPKKA